MSQTPETIAAIESEYAAKIETALRAVEARRDVAFIDIPFLVAGEPLRPMCLPDFLTLIAAGNAHVTGTVPDSLDFEKFWALHNAQFMWVLSPKFTPVIHDRDSFLKRIGLLPFNQVCNELDEYLRDTFGDAPRPARNEGQSTAVPLRVSFAAVWYYRLATRMHWSRAEIRGTPIREIFQVFRVLDFFDTLEAGKQPAQLCDETDALWAEMLGRITALNKQPVSLPSP